MKEANDEVLARFTRADVEAFAYVREESRTFVKEYAEKWNDSFVRELLGGARP